MPYASGMTRSSGIRLGALLVLLSLFAACHPSTFLRGASAPPPSVKTPFHTEQEWIISSICRNIFELLSYANDKKGESITADQLTLTQVPGDVLAYDVSLRRAQGTVQARLQWPASIWSSSAYQPFCQAAAQALKLGPASSASAQGNPLHALLDFSESAIEAENQRISQWLNNDPANPAALEQAALVLGTLAMKENSGPFWDPRGACNHASAYLAVAQYLRAGAPASIEGRLAGSLVGLIADTKAQTGRELDQLARENPTPDLSAWINAGRMRNSRDYRLLPKPENATPLEQIEYFRAVAEAISTDQAVAWWQAHLPSDQPDQSTGLPGRPDWGRIVLEIGCSVDSGHLLAQNSITEEIHVMQATFPGSFGRGGLVTDLNRAPADVLGTEGADAGKLSVIDQGMWAHFFQRHLCLAIEATGNFFENLWGVPENTRQLDDFVDKTFSSLTFYPYLQLYNQRIRHASADPAAAAAFFAEHPQWGPELLFEINPGQAPELKRLTSGWFTPVLLQGTAYSAFARLRGRAGEEVSIDALYAIAPLQFRVAELELTRHDGNSFTYEQAQQVLGSMIDYYVPALDLARRAHGLTFDQQIELAKKSAAIDPDNYYGLAQLYLNQGQNDKAAEAYQQWYDKATDRVEVSNSIDWLVTYYYDHGQSDKAMAIATEAAQVYSYRGLQTMMDLQEKMGQLDTAEDYGKKILERYNDNSPLIAFYQRQVNKGNSSYQDKLHQHTATAFPDGLKKVTLDSFSGPPATGFSFAQTTEAMQRAGLSSEQVVVALDGYAVQNQAQYVSVRALSISPTMKFIVWDGQAYREITVNQPGRRFGVDMRDYSR